MTESAKACALARQVLGLDEDVLWGLERLAACSFRVRSIEEAERAAKARTWIERMSEDA